MIPLQQLIRPTWGADKPLDDAWSILHDEEKLIIKQRVDDMFYNELPFALEHDKIFYIHLFSLLTQLEIFGLQGLLKSLQKLAGTALEGTMRQQIMDEIFHAIVFVKITYELSSPFALPPTYNKSVEKFMFHVINEPDLNTSLVLINLVAEGWIEEIFMAMKEHKIAPRVFDVVLEDESRHVHDSDLFLQSGLPEKKYLAKKLESFEEELITMMFSQHKYVLTLTNLLGIEGSKNLIKNIDKKHRKSLAKIGFEPTKNWQYFMDTIPSMIDDIYHDQGHDTLVDPTSLRKIFSSIWSNPNSPTQSSIFGLNVTAIGFFEKKFGPETITCLFLQAISKACTDRPHLRNYMSHHKIYNPEHSYVGLAVHLPNCGDHLGQIEFKNCHEMSISELSRHIQHDMKIMAYCHQKTQALKKEHPWLMDIFNETFIPHDHHVYPEPLFGRPTISLSNIGHWGYEETISPLFPNETVKFTLGKIRREQVWNNTDKQFIVQDTLPAGLSADHRVFDGNIPIPYIIQAAFDEMFTAMLQPHDSEQTLGEFADLEQFIQLSDKLMEEDLEFAFRYLFFSSQVWRNHKEQTTLMNKAKQMLVEGRR